MSTSPPINEPLENRPPLPVSSSLLLAVVHFLLLLAVGPYSVRLIPRVPAHPLLLFEPGVSLLVRFLLSFGSCKARASHVARTTDGGSYAITMYITTWANDSVHLMQKGWVRRNVIPLPLLPLLLVTFLLLSLFLPPCLFLTSCPGLLLPMSLLFVISLAPSYSCASVSSPFSTSPA